MFIYVLVYLKLSYIVTGKVEGKCIMENLKIIFIKEIEKGLIVILIFKESVNRFFGKTII